MQHPPPHGSLSYLSPEEFARRWNAASLSATESMAVDQPLPGRAISLPLFKKAKQRSVAMISYTVSDDLRGRVSIARSRQAGRLNTLGLETSFILEVRHIQ